MKLENVKITEEQLLSRKKFTADLVSQAATPSKKDLTAQIAKSTGSKEDHIVMIKVDTLYGSKNGKVSAYVYDNLEAKEKITGNTKKVREADRKNKEEAIKKYREEKAKKAETKA